MQGLVEGFGLEVDTKASDGRYKFFKNCEKTRPNNMNLSCHNQPIKWTKVNRIEDFFQRGHEKMILSFISKSVLAFLHIL